MKERPHGNEVYFKKNIKERQHVNEKPVDFLGAYLDK